jgi:hypothetical protein
MGKSESCRCGSSSFSVSRGGVSLTGIDERVVGGAIASADDSACKSADL